MRNASGPLIYVVDDNQVLCENTAQYLSGQGFATRCFFDAAGLEAGLREKTCDLILLDIMLPGEDGLNFFRRLRTPGGIKVIFVSALGEENDRIVGLELGAEDYLVKPFSPRELIARIRIALRRADPADRDRQVLEYRFSGWSMEPRARLLTNPQGVTRNLSGSEYRLLRFFLDHPQEVLERETLFKVLKRPSELASDQALDMQISRLRACLGESASSQKLIRTSRGDGYLLASDVEKSHEPV